MSCRKTWNVAYQAAKLNGCRKILLLTSVKIFPLILFIVREVIANSELLKVNYTYSTEYQQLSLTVVLLLRVMALYLPHIIIHITGPSGRAT